MGENAARLLPATMLLKCILGEIIQPAGIITLSVLVGSPSRIALVIVDFFVVRPPSSYNAIIGRPTLNKLKAITFTYHLKIKFSTIQGVGEIRREQASVRECYVQELKPMTRERMPNANMRLS